MSEMSSLRRALPQSEYAKQRKNLLRICGMVLKSVVDKYCFEGVLTDSDGDVRNLLVILENILMHRCKTQGKWFSDETPSYWPCVVTSCSKLKRSCVPSILEMGNGLSGLALGRIFLQMALMERRLSEYLSELLEPEGREIMNKVYEADAFMLKEEGAALPHMCLGLTAIDFSFCPKGENLDYQYVPCIDFTPYLDFNPCSEALLDDKHEQAVLSGEIERHDVYVNEGDGDEVSEWKAKYQTLYLKYRDLSQQKNYAEEMLRLKECRIDKLERESSHQRLELESERIAHKRECAQLRELQAELANIQHGDRFESDRRRLELYLTGLSMNGKFHEAIALKEMNTRKTSTSSQTNPELLSPAAVVPDAVFHNGSPDEIQLGVNAFERFSSTDSNPVRKEDKMLMSSLDKEPR